MKRILEFLLIFTVILTLVAVVMGETTVNNGIADRTADRVFGQPSFYTANIGADPASMVFPFGCAVDSQGSLWLADPFLNLVRKYSAVGGAPADTVADLSMGWFLWGGMSDTMLYEPEALNFDSAGNMYCLDFGNNRLLRFNADSDGIVRDTTADLVIGEAGYEAFYEGVSDTMIDIYENPPVFDAFGNMYLGDGYNNRVLRFDAASTGVVNDTTADFVIGQAGFDTEIAGTSDTMLSIPVGLAIDAWGNLYVSDADNNRILRFNANASGLITDTTADFVIGQAGFDTYFYGTSDTMFGLSYGILFDAQGGLWVADILNYRLLRFDSDSTGLITDTTADFVIGGGDPNGGFDSGVPGLSDTMLTEPVFPAMDADGRLYVPDYSNHRVIVFMPTMTIFSDDDDCFIATAAYGEESREVAVLHTFRDEVLMTSCLGRGLVGFYYERGPVLAARINSPMEQRVVRASLLPLVGLAGIVTRLGLGLSILLVALSGGLYWTFRERIAR